MLTQLLLILIALTIYAFGGDFNTPHCFCDITHQCFAGKKLNQKIILRAGTSIYASSGFGPLAPKPCGGNYFNIDL
jgi:hypothetical protein